MTNGEASPEQRSVDDVLFITAPALVPGEVQLHRDFGKDLTRSLADVKKDWDVVMTQVAQLVSGTDSDLRETGYRLDEISVALGFNAKGKLAFIAEAGVEASISVKFTKPT